jgi:prepilin-type N-terminal cleavage/methylation domain-containing protein
MVLRMSNERREGFTLVELAIVLGVIGVLSAGLWRLMTAGNQQSKDQVTAQQQLALIGAVKSYMADTTATGGQTILTAMDGTTATPKVLLLPATNTSLAACKASIPGHAALCSYLPPGFSAATTNPYGQTYPSFGILKDSNAAGTPAQSYSFMIAATGGTLIPDPDGGRISGLIGGDGGFVYTSSAICAAGWACGSMGAWTTKPATYGLAAAAGSVVSRTFVSAMLDNSYQWLARIPIPGDSPAFNENSMATDLFMGSTTSPGPYTIHMGNSGTTTGTSMIDLQNGYIKGAGANANPQINFSQSIANAKGFDTPLVQLNNKCSQLDAGGAGCPLTINIIDGDVGVGGQVTATKLYSSSDARLKTDIKPIGNALDDLMKINPVSFTFKAGGSRSLGVTAQNLETVYPQLVTESRGSKYVEYTGLIGPLIAAVQELKKQNDDLRSQLDQQKQREDHFERKLNKSP